ncbi:hypothetical protein B0H14DRAFT_2561044 [Mycena olivaceomarginata]|nr:hypothetical protein B0H14DRAFT_2561044 [Mycena olivaceomarginata]
MLCDMPRSLWQIRDKVSQSKHQVAKREFRHSHKNMRGDQTAKGNLPASQPSGACISHVFDHRTKKEDGKRGREEMRESGDGVRGRVGWALSSLGDRTTADEGRRGKAE